MSHDIDPVFLCDDNVELKKKPANDNEQNSDH